MDGFIGQWLDGGIDKIEIHRSMVRWRDRQRRDSLIDDEMGE